jgi:hypothetical protein
MAQLRSNDVVGEEHVDVAVPSPARGSQMIEGHVAWLVQCERDRMQMLRRTLSKRQVLNKVIARGGRADSEAWGLLSDVMDAVVMYVVQQHLRHDPWDLLSELAYHFEAMLEGNHGGNPLVANVLHTCIETIDDALVEREAPEDRDFPRRGGLNAAVARSPFATFLARWDGKRFSKDGGVRWPRRKDDLGRHR